MELPSRSGEVINRKLIKLPPSSDGVTHPKLMKLPRNSDGVTHLVVMELPPMELSTSSDGVTTHSIVMELS